MEPHVITISQLAVSRDGITHRVRLPGWSGPVGTESLEDARKVAEGFRPNDGRAVEVRLIERGTTRPDPEFAARQAKRATALGLAESVHIPL